MKAWEPTPATTPEPAPPVPWRPDGEGWDTYRLGDVLGLEGWEIGAITNGRGPFPCTDEHTDRLAGLFDDTVIYARPIPEPPIQVGDRVTWEQGDARRAVVLAVDGGFAWVLWTAGMWIGHRNTVTVAELRRLPADASEPRP